MPSLVCDTQKIDIPWYCPSSLYKRIAGFVYMSLCRISYAEYRPSMCVGHFSLLVYSLLVPGPAYSIIYNNYNAKYNV